MFNSIFTETAIGTEKKWQMKYTFLTACWQQDFFSLKGQCHEIFYPFFHDSTHLDPLFTWWIIFAYGFLWHRYIHVCKKTSVSLNNAEKSSAVSWTPLSQSEQCLWHQGVKYIVYIIQGFSSLHFKETVARKFWFRFLWL